MKQYQLVFGIALGLLTHSTTFSARVPSTGTPPDNSGINERDRREGELTADQSGTGKQEMRVTRLIRKEIMKNENLSTYAHNVKIIAHNGSVTLKGPIRNQQEMDIVTGIANKVAGFENVKNEMQITSGD